MNTIDRHNQMPDTFLVLTAPGASQADIERGIAAVWDAFNAIDVHPYAAAQAALDQENFAETDSNDGQGEFPLTDEEYEWATLWRNAGEVAMEACGRKHDALDPDQNWIVELDWPDRVFGAI